MGCRRRSSTPPRSPRCEREQLAVLAAETLGRPDASAAGVVGAGVNGRAVARMFRTVGREVVLWDVDRARAEAVADELGASVATAREEALSADVVATVTPGKEIVVAEGALRPGQHVRLMGADGPGKAEIAVGELARVHVFCDDWKQVVHSGTLDTSRAVEEGVLRREDVTELGAVLAGLAPGRRSDDEITVFDSTGLAIQDLAIALAALERADELDLSRIEV